MTSRPVHCSARACPSASAPRTARDQAFSSASRSIRFAPRVESGLSHFPSTGDVQQTDSLPIESGPRPDDKNAQDPAGHRRKRIKQSRDSPLGIRHLPYPPRDRFEPKEETDRKIGPLRRTKPQTLRPLPRAVSATSRQFASPQRSSPVSLPASRYRSGAHAVKGFGICGILTQSPNKVTKPSNGWSFTYSNRWNYTARGMELRNLRTQGIASKS